MATNITKEEDKAKNDVKRRILIPVDASEHCIRAFNWYLDQLHLDGDLIVVLHIVEPALQPHAHSLHDVPFVFDDSYSKIMEQNIQKGKKLCKDYVRQARKKDVPTKAFIHIDSDPGQAIVKSCQEHSADIVVMGNRGLSAIRRTFMGSVSEYVLHHVHIPVAIISPPDLDSTQTAIEATNEQ